MITDLPLPVVALIAFLVLASVAFTYGCAKAEGARWHADVAAPATVAFWGLDVLLWDHDWIAAPCGVLATLSAVVLLALANGWWKP